MRFPRYVIAVTVLALTASILWNLGPIWFWLQCSGSPVSFVEADLNHDGNVTFTEAEYVCDYGVRTIDDGGKQCTEYFAYKDGIPVKIVCP